jgi:hypothetical protein
MFSASTIISFIISSVLLVKSGHAAESSSAIFDGRDLQIADWNVTITAITDQTVTFTTGAGAGTSPSIKINVFNKCRIEGTDGVDQGSLYGGVSPITGIVRDGTGDLTPGGSDSISFLFDEGIDGNAAIYTATPANNTATVRFCMLVGLYENDVMVNFAEAKLTYNIDLITNVATLAGYAETTAAANNASTAALEFTGTLAAYFCDNSNTIINSGATTVQGQLINVCFKVTDGQYEVRNVTNLTITNSDDATSQVVINNRAIESASTPYAELTCTDASAADENICVVKLLLKAAFFTQNVLTLTGNGDVEVEVGGRRQLRAVRFMQEGTTTTQAPYEITPVQFEAVSADQQQGATGSSANAVALGFGTAVLGSAALLL